MAIKNLVFSGGHFKGISYIGVLRALEELNIKKKLKDYIRCIIWIIIYTTICSWIIKPSNRNYT